MVRDILLVQQRELKRRLGEKYIERAIGLRGLDNNLIKVIIGPRRAGKSFFAIHLLNKIGGFGYVNFDDERLLGVKDYDEVIAAINSIYNNPKYLLLDEIQNLDKWELFVNRLQREGFNIIVTGSNANLLSRELSTHLTGRHILTSIFPFSFKEFLKVDDRELTKNEIKEKLHDYLKYGGYPEPLVNKIDHKDYISTLFASTIYKDIVKRFNIRFPQAIEDLAVYLISNIAKEFSYNTLTEITKCKSAHTVEKYISHLEEAFIFFKLDRFSFKLKEQLASNKKIYCIDNGIVYAKAFKFSPDIGRIYENTVALELKKMEINGLLRFYFWKNPQQEEVDFVITENMKVKQLIQVCYNIEEKNAKKRELRALLKASQELKCNNLLLITNDYEREESVEWFGIKRKVVFMPLWKWLLAKN